MAPTTSGLPLTSDLGEIRERVRLVHNWRHPSVTSSVGRDAVCRILFWLDAVPHVAARDPHQWSLKFSFADPKGLFQHYLPQAEVRR
jgi:hypothetical protein